MKKNKVNQIDHEHSPAWAFATEQRQRWAYWLDAFTPEECDTIINNCSVYKTLKAQTQGNTDDDYRVSDITWINPTVDFNWMYNRLANITIDLNERFFGFDLWGFGEALQFTRYQAPSGKYDSHIDCFSIGGAIRKLSFVLQLSDSSDYEGGDLELIYEKIPEKLPRKRGTLLVFPSFTLHRVTPITKGSRHSLVGWVTGPAFK
jgi:PKHD-type hydroxylase